MTAFPTYNWWLKTTTNETYAFLKEAFTPEECAKIIEIGENPDTASVGSPSIAGGKINDTIRKCSLNWIRSDIEENKWIFQRLSAIVPKINEQFFNFDLEYFESLQFTKYEASEDETATDDFYSKHIDMLYSGVTTRKLSFTIQLSDPETYEGGDLRIHSGSEHTIPRDQGTFTGFPSYILHEVEPVTKGTRYSLVGWVCGARFK